MNGRKLYVIPVTTAKAVAVIVVSGPIKFKLCKTEITGPSAPKICFHAIVRNRKDVKNGAITKTNNIFLYLPLLNAIA